MMATDVLSDKLEMPMEEDAHDGAEEEDEDIEEVEEEEEEEEEEEGDDSITHGRRSGRGLTLMTLLKEKVLLPGLGNMTINYLGNKFKGDLLSDGRIRSQETGKVFGTPSAWAIYCKQIVNPNKKSGCGWASVKYRGKKLDEYKNNWNRQKRLEFEREGDEMECEEDGASCSESEGGDPHDHEILEFDMLHTRHDPPYMGNPLVELTTFSSLGRLQPFTVAASSSAMAVLDLHVHLSRAEAVGFLAGQWDVNNHNLIVSHAFPLCCDVTAAADDNSSAGHAAEAAIHRQMASLKLALVGWYHSHPHSSALPSLRDVDSQLDYEMKMKGTNDASYTPCIGFIIAPFNELNTQPSSVLPCNIGSSAATIAASNTSQATTPSATESTTTSTTAAASTTTVTASSTISSNGNGATNNTNVSNAVSSAVLTTTTTEASIIHTTTDPTTFATSTLSITPVPATKATDTTTNSTGFSTPTLPAATITATVTPSAITATAATDASCGLTAMNCFWVMPPPEHRPHEYPRPMCVVYNVVQDAFVPKEALIHMRECVKFYSTSEDAINLHDTYVAGVTYWDKLKRAIKARVPKDHFAPLIEYLHKILRIKFPLPELLQPPSPVPSREKEGTKESPEKEEKMDLSTDSLHASSAALATITSLMLKTKDGRDSSVEMTAVRPTARALLSSSANDSVRTRPYPDPAKIHPLLVDRSDERTIQPLILDRASKTGISHPLLTEQCLEKAHIQQILGDQPQPSKGQNAGENNRSGSVPLPATQNPPEYPFPLLRGMMAEQVSNIQKQQEQRYEDELTLQKEKQLFRSNPQQKQEQSNPLTDKELLMQINEKFLLQQRQQTQDQQQEQKLQQQLQFKAKQSSESKIQSVSSLLSGRAETGLPAYPSSGLHQYGREGADSHRGSPPPYPALVPKLGRDLSIFPSPLSSKSTESFRKGSNEESGRYAGQETQSVSLTPTHNFSPMSFLNSSGSSISDASSLLPHNLTITPTSGNSQSTASSILASISNSPATLSITSVTRESPISLAALQCSATTSSLTITSQSSTISSSPLTLSGQHPSSLSSSFYPNQSSNVSSSPLSSGHTPNLSPSPISFNPPRTNSPSLSSTASVEVSPRHTEWAQNALAGMARPPIISVKSQAALTQQPYSPGSVSSSPVTSSSAAADMALSSAAALAALGSNTGTTSSAISQATLAEAISSGAAADQWMQASFAGLTQFPGYGGNQFSKPPPQYSDQFQYRSPLLPPTDHHHEQRK